METKTLLSGLIGFFIGGLLVSVAATTFEKPAESVRKNHSSEQTLSLKNKTGDEFDRVFIEHMIEHHEGAVDVALLAEKNAKHEEIKELSKAIIRNQSAEIWQMEQWQKQWGYSEGTASEHQAN